jgi:heme-degrading monooxygenase HmoA
VFTRIVWGKVLPGKWDDFEVAYKRAIKARGPVEGLQVQWLARDQQDSDAGYSVSLWATQAAMTAYVGSKLHMEMTASLMPFFVNQYTATHCEVKCFERSVPKWEPGDMDIYHTN